MEMAAFYNNLFSTADLRTILQATVNNIQIGEKEVETMKALQHIYTSLATKMDLKLPFILERLLDSKMQQDIAENGRTFLLNQSNGESQQIEPSFQCKFCTLDDLLI